MVWSQENTEQPEDISIDWIYRSGKKKLINFTYTIHLVLECPIIGDTKGVDNTGVLVEDQIQADELVSVNLFSCGS